MKQLIGIKTPILSDEERLLIRKSILLPSVLTFAERGLSELYVGKSLANGLIGELYVGCVKVIIQRIMLDIRDTNKSLSSESIRVDRESVNETTVAYRVIFRGQVNNVEITKDEARKEICSLKKSM
jgi:hypothetical protein